MIVNHDGDHNFMVDYCDRDHLKFRDRNRDQKCDHDNFSHVCLTDK